MKISVEVTRQDFMAFNTYNLKSTQQQIKEHQGIFSRLLSKSFFFLYLLMMTGTYLFLNLDFISMFITLGFFLLLIIFILFEQKRIQKGMIKYMLDDAGMILGSHTYTITDDGLRHETENHTSLTQWTGIFSIESIEDLILIYIDNSAAFLIPKRFFSSPLEAREFVRLVEEKIEK